MKEIPITKGCVALVDDDDYDRLNVFRWSYHGDGYAARGYHHNGRLIILKMHQAIMGKAPDGMVIDHINGNKLDNRKSNLRFVTQQQNVFNTRKRVLKNPGIKPSKYKGVKWRKDRNKWLSRITKDGKRQYLGMFDTEEEAAQAYNAAAIKLYGEFAWLNRV